MYSDEEMLREEYAAKKASKAPVAEAQSYLRIEEMDVLSQANEDLTYMCRDLSALSAERKEDRILNMCIENLMNRAEDVRQDLLSLQRSLIQK